MRIHRNLHNARRGGPQWIESNGRKKVRELSAVRLSNVTTKVYSPNYCRKVWERQVVAYFDGEPQPAICGPENQTSCYSNWARVSYDPRTDDAFLADGQPFNRADEAVMLECGTTYVLNPSWSES